MKVTRVKLWMFRIEREDGQAFTLNRRGDVWVIGYEGLATSRQGGTLFEALEWFFPPEAAKRVIDDIVEVLVRDGIKPEGAHA